jgi:hypothetical protein
MAGFAFVEFSDATLAKDAVNGTVSISSLYTLIIY